MIDKIVLSEKYDPPSNVLTWIRVFTEPDLLVAWQGVGIHKRLAAKVLNSQDFHQVASAGRIGRNIYERKGILVYKGGGSLVDGGFTYNASEFDMSLSIVARLMQSVGSVKQGFE